jgi:altronate hydrolase
MHTRPLVDSIRLHVTDNVCVAARTLKPGDVISGTGEEVTLQQEVIFGHKVAIVPIREGESILKYGQSIGVATCDIAPGEWVHSHNLAQDRSSKEYPMATATPLPPQAIEGRTFMGYQRAGGKAGTRNYIGIISTVNCSASVSKYVAQRFDERLLADYPNVDGVVAFTHDTGCGMEHLGQKHRMLNQVLGGMARQPNIGAYLIMGLGCEQTNSAVLIEEQKLVQIAGHEYQDGRPPVLIMQDLGGTVKSVEAGVKAIAELLPRANDVKRLPIAASNIVLGTECGGSDGNSGITANPAVGIAADRIVACGGTAILAETTEIWGAEQLLTGRAVSVEVAQKLLDRLAWWEWYAGIHGSKFDHNPSAGNKAGGLTTIAEKSLGAVAKGGSTALVEVYEYAEPVTAKGFVIMDTPGFDAASITGMVAGGDNVVVFTTGRGSCYGCKPTPSIKIATNSPMYDRMVDDMDINAGVILEGSSVEQVGEQIFEEILEVASGKKTKSEVHGIGQEEFAPWTVGPVL